MNHLFVSLSGGGRSSVSGTDPHFDSAGGAFHGVMFPFIQVDGRSGLHRKPDELHSPPCRRPRGTRRTESTCFDLDTARSVKGAGLAQADSGLLSLPYEATRFAGSPRPRVHRVRRDDLWTSASLPRIPSAQVPSSRRSSVCGANPFARPTARNWSVGSTKVNTQRGELSRLGQACLLVYQCLLGVLRRRAHSSAC